VSDQQTLDVGIEPECSPEDLTTDRDDSADSAGVDEPVDDTRSLYPGGETRESTYTYYRSVCEDHPAPGRQERGGLTHHQFSFASIDGDDEYEQAMKDKLTPDECSCEGSIETTEVTGMWPLEDLTSDAILGLFQETNGEIVIEFYPDDYDERFYIGEIGGRYCIEGEHYQDIDLPTGVDDLPDLVRKHPNRLSTVQDTSLEGIFEDYQNGEV
jgi:hypothetical protein